jgi:ergothioneine biosynthesis protein EgtB
MSLYRADLIRRYRHVRRRTEVLSSWLSPEDQQVQSMPDASPTKWHRAHTTWFFEQFLLGPHGIAPRHDGFAYLFNSYYDGVGARHPRPQRGLLTRPDHATVTAWRGEVDDAVVALLQRSDDDAWRALLPILHLGLAHEEQHQELIITDALHLLSHHPRAPALHPPSLASRRRAPAPVSPWQSHEGGLVVVGRDLTSDDLVFDNEGPSHRVFLEPFSLGTSLVTVAALRAFIDAGGYDTPSLWLATGFDEQRRLGRRAPLYVRRRDDDGALLMFSVVGERVLSDDEPISHLSFYEADALARFLGARLPSEAEWEVAAVAADADPGVGFDLDDGDLTSLLPPIGGTGFFGSAWQWTRSSYEAYPGFRAAAGVVGEYNGKFMVGQYVLRGSSSYTPRGHSRLTYRNFWPAPTSFQNAGLRLARDG